MTRPEPRVSGLALALVLLAGACAGPAPSPPASTTPSPPAPSSIPVDLDGRIYALDCLGTAAAGTPTVVLVGGLGVPVTTWLPVQAELADEPMRTCAVDRPSVYAVAPGDERRTVAVWVRELRAALAEAGIRPPVVLVGHSLGGLAIDLFAREHPEEVTGLVFLDAIQPTFDARLEPMLVPSALAARRRDLELNEEGIVFGDILASEEEVAAAPPLPDVPAVVLVHGDPFGEETAAWPSARAEALWTELQRGLADQLPMARLAVAGRSGHRIQHDRPDLVAEAIREILATATTAR